jgi:hypothetical protein
MERIEGLLSKNIPAEDEIPINSLSVYASNITLQIHDTRSKAIMLRLVYP